MAAVVLVSGGMDSSTLLHYVHQRLGEGILYALSFQYGQRHRRELEMARWQCERVGAVVDWQTVDIGFYGALTEGATALAGESVEVPALADIPEGELDQPITYVPHRNLVMLSLAAGFAESRGCATVYYGAQAQDEYGYWDCTSTFVERLNGVLGLNRRGAVSIEAPFAGMRKADELRLGMELGVDFAHTWTCYRGGELACGVCPSCVERLRAFAEAGLVDPLDYAQR